MIDPLPQTGDARPAQWGLWATLGWSLLVAFAFVVLQIATLFGLAAAGYVADLSEPDGTIIAWSSLATGILCTALVIGIVKLKRGSSVAVYLRLKPVSGGTMFRWLAITVALIAIADFIMVASGRPIVPEFMQKAYASAEPMALFWIALVLAAPLFEEVFFRGFLFTAFESSPLGPSGAIVVTAAVWAAIHLQYDAFEMVLILCAGLVLGIAKVMTGSLLVPLAMHATMNLVATAETALLVTR